MRKIHQVIGNGRIWMVFWTTGACLALASIYPAVTIWIKNLVYVNAASAIALWLGCMAGLQATLAMRKSDPKDPL